MIFRKAVLIIHGFAGGTYDQEYLANYLEVDPFLDVYQFTLPGHRKNLSKVKYQEWIEESEHQLNLLLKRGYKSIYLIGHSMGGVIASYLATKYNCVKKLVLGSPAFHYLSITRDNSDLINSIKDTSTVIKTYGRSEVIARFLKLDISTLKEFINLVKKYYDYPKEIKCPVLLLYGLNDNLVPKSSVEYVYDNIKSSKKTLIYVENATHDLFRGLRKDDISKEVYQFLKDKGSEGIVKI